MYRKLQKEQRRSISGCLWFCNWYDQMSSVPHYHFSLTTCPFTSFHKMIRDGIVIEDENCVFKRFTFALYQKYCFSEVVFCQFGTYSISGILTHQKERLDDFHIAKSLFRYTNSKCFRQGLIYSLCIK